MTKCVHSLPVMILAASILLNRGDAIGQWYAGLVTNGASPAIGYGALYGYGLGYGYANYGGAQTAEGAYLSGMSNLVRAEGAYNEYTAKAMMNYEQARAQYIENRQRAVSAAAESRRILKAEETKRREQEEENRVQGAQFAESHKPMPLSQSRFDQRTGRLEWPALLTTKEFDASRRVLDDLIVQRAKSPRTPGLSTQIAQKTAEMKDTLREHILLVPLPDYTEARRFLERLAVSIN